MSINSSELLIDIDKQVIFSYEVLLNTKEEEREMYRFE